MKTFIRFITAAAVLLASLPAPAQDTLVVGIAPHTSARVILEMYQPLRTYLEKYLGMPVQIVTASDFDAFALRGIAQEFDIAITTGHQARLLQKDAQYIPLLTYKADFRALVFVAAKGPVHKPADLKGQDVIGLSAASLVTLWGEQWLSDNRVGAKPVKYVSASDSVAQLVVAGDAAAGFASRANYQKLVPEVRNQLRVLAESTTMSGRVYVLNRRRAPLQKKITAALWAFAATPEAKKYFETNKLEGYRNLRPKELEAMDIYADKVRKVLGSHK